MRKILVFLVFAFALVFAKINVVNISPSELENIKILDVRMPKEWAQTGVIKNSIKVSFINDDGELNPNFLQEVKNAGIGENEPLAIVCRSGSRSARAAKYLESNGFNNIKDLTGGVNSLIEQGYVLEDYK